MVSTTSRPSRTSSRGRDGDAFGLPAAPIPGAHEGPTVISRTSLRCWRSALCALPISAAKTTGSFFRTIACPPHAPEVSRGDKGFPDGGSWRAAGQVGALDEDRGHRVRRRSSAGGFAAQGATTKPREVRPPTSQGYTTLTAFQRLRSLAGLYLLSGPLSPACSPSIGCAAARCMRITAYVSPSLGCRVQKRVVNVCSRMTRQTGTELPGHRFQQ